MHPKHDGRTSLLGDVQELVVYSNILPQQFPCSLNPYAIDAELMHMKMSWKAARGFSCPNAKRFHDLFAKLQLE